MRLALLLFALIAQPCAAGDWRLLEPDRLQIEVWGIEDHRDMYFPYNKPGSGGEEWVGGAAFEIDLNFVAYKKWAWYWRNRPFMNTTNRQVREAGWEWESGISYDKCAEVYWYHLSDHVLDADVPGKYPLHNFYGVRVTFFDKERKCWKN